MNANASPTMREGHDLHTLFRRSLQRLAMTEPLKISVISRLPAPQTGFCRLQALVEKKSSFSAQAGRFQMA
jgi:hypothetical protein